MRIFTYWIKGLGIAISSAVVLSTNSAFAKINQDATLPNNFDVATQEKIRIIKGETQSESNLSHSFKEFSLLTVGTAYFKNNAFLNTSGLFLVSTMSSLNFTDSNKFSATVYLHNLNKSNFGTVLENYPVSKDNVLKFHYTINTTKLQNRNPAENQQAQEFLQTIEDGKILQLACWVVNGGCVNFP